MEVTKMKRKIISLFSCFVLMLSMVTTAFAANQFTDVSKHDYFYESVMWALDNGITSGTTTTTFSPYATCTRGQVATFLWRMKGQPEPTTINNPFDDVKESDYFYKAVLWAVEQGITVGTSKTTFSPSNNCTYAQVITFLWRAEGEPLVENASSTTAYGDVYYKNAAVWADFSGVLAGSNNQFFPDKDCPRADIVTYMYYTILDKYNLSTDGIIGNEYRSYVEIDGKLYEAGFLCEKWSGFYSDSVTGETYIDVDSNTTSTPYSGLIMLSALLEGNYTIEDSDNPFVNGIIDIDGSNTSLKLTVNTNYISAAEKIDKCTYQRNGVVLESAELNGSNYSMQNGIRCFNDDSRLLYNLNDVLTYLGYTGVSVSSDMLRQDLNGHSVLIVTHS
jgi:hypothetical protein